MNIKAGDKVRYTGPRGCELTSGKVYDVVDARSHRVEVLDDVGDVRSLGKHSYEPVTDTPQAIPDYNNGEWHGWNGGARPIHRECLIDHVWHDGKKGTAGITKGRLAKTAAWDQTLKFRVTKPYVEPKLEVVEAYAQAALDGGFEVSSFADYWDWRITFNTIDGKPDPASIKMERLSD